MQTLVGSRSFSGDPVIQRLQVQWHHDELHQVQRGLMRLLVLRNPFF